MKNKLSLLICLLFWPLCIMAQNQKIAILETVDRDNSVSYAVKLMLRSNLAKAITNAPGYEAYDRSDMDAIMGEQNFQRTGLVSDEQIKRLGEMTGASYILVAEAAKVDDKSVFITAKILDVETAKTERTDNILMGINAVDMQRGCVELANNLLGVKIINAEIAQSSHFSNLDKEKSEEMRQTTSESYQESSLTNQKKNSANVSVGKIITFSDGSRGVVFYTDEKGHGLAVSLDEATLKWENVNRQRDCHDLSLPNEQVTYALTFKRGESNTKIIISELGMAMAPAAAWCVRHGEGWYLPSGGELWYLFANANAGGKISTSIALEGGLQFRDGWYWSSTENDNDDVLNVSSNGRISTEEKQEILPVRAVRAF